MARTAGSRNGTRTTTVVEDYRWRQEWEVPANADDPVAVGDRIWVTSSNGRKEVEVLAVAVVKTMNGEPRKRLIVQ